MSVSFLLVSTLSDVCADLMVDAGLAGTACSDGHRALDLLGATRYSAVFCNLKISDSIELMDRVREGFPEVAFVMVTKPTDLRHGILAMMSGASDYIHTPLRPCTISASLTRALMRKRIECALLRPRRALSGCAASPAVFVPATAVAARSRLVASLAC